MAFGASHVFSSFLADAVVGKTYELGSTGTPDTFKLALFNNTTDSATAALDTLAHNTYLAVGGQFVTANEITGTNWAAGGVTLASPTTTPATSGTALAHWAVSNVSVASVTISSGFFGCLVYDSTNSSKGICMVTFGGSFTVGGGTLAINWGNDSNASACVFYITT